MPKTKNKQENYVILHEDEHHYVINKPAGMGCVPDRRDEDRLSLVEHLRKLCPEVVMVHRLDVDTTGIVLAAKHKDAMRWLSGQFARREVKKEYVCWVKGYVPFQELDVNRPVGPILRKGATVTRRRGKDSLIRFEKEKTYGNYCKLRCLPMTGRTHQIRIHLADMGLAIVGDEKYGGEYPMLSQIKKNYSPSGRKYRKEQPLVRRVALHARRITYIPFGTEEDFVILCEEPKDLRIFEDKLSRFGRRSRPQYR